MRSFDTFVYFLIVGILGFVIAQDELPIQEEILKQVPELSNIPGLANLNISTIKTEDAEKLLKEKCEKNGGPTAYQIAKESLPYMVNCLQSLVNISQLEAEMAAARPRGELDTVFIKYCKKIPTLKKCVKHVTEAIKPCLEPEEQENIIVIHNITSSLLQFICDNEGDRIAMFIAGGGKECIAKQLAAVQKCANDTFGSYIPAINPMETAATGLTRLPSFILTLKECTEIQKFQDCTVKVLEECTDPTPANVVDSLLNYVKKVTPCQNLLKARSLPSTYDQGSVDGKGGSTTVINVLSMTVLMAMSLQFV